MYFDIFISPTHHHQNQHYCCVADCSSSSLLTASCCISNPNFPSEWFSLALTCPFCVSLFLSAEECFLDSDLSFLVPIAVGVALSFLIILVLISYLIGRRKSRTGYQSV